MSGHDTILFFGRFHPLLVHLPIGALVLAVFLEVLARFTRFHDAAQQNPFILTLGAAAAVGAALCGWMLSTSGDYDPALLRWHKWMGITLVAATLVTAMASLSHKAAAYRCSLAGAALLLIPAAHLGGSLTHGKDFLTQYAPPPVRRWLRPGLRVAAARQEPDEKKGQSVYLVSIAPLLRKDCSGCHGPDKRKADLRVDDYNSLMKGGKSGPVLIPGSSEQSEMMRRLLLPTEHDDHMPPSGKPQPTTAEIKLLTWWINTGAQTNRTTSQLTLDDDVQRLLAAREREAAK